MQRHRPQLLLAAAFATTFVVWSTSSQSVAASGGNGSSVAEIDTDGDFLPDVVEWVALTDSTNPDTDGDQNPDFIEVIESGQPRHESPALPADQQLRVFITGPAPGSADPLTWMHVFHRVMPTAGVNLGVGAISSFQTWLESPSLPGLQIPLNAFAAAGTVYRERVTAEQGTWVQISMPLVSEPLLQAVLPCTVCAQTTVSGQQLQSGHQLIQVPAGIATLVPFEEDRYVLQTLSPVPTTSTSLTVESNKVCILTLEEDSTGPAGTTYVVSAADCEDANDLECDTSCSQSVGWTVTIPGGTELLSGN